MKLIKSLMEFEKKWNRKRWRSKKKITMKATSPDCSYRRRLKYNKQGFWKISRFWWSINYQRRHQRETNCQNRITFHSFAFINYSILEWSNFWRFTWSKLDLFSNSNWVHILGRSKNLAVAFNWLLTSAASFKLEIFHVVILMVNIL